ncbi:MAG: WD40 repeat domain-containing protein, partial [Promethearchaeota archaeon]
MDISYPATEPETHLNHYDPSHKTTVRSLKSEKTEIGRLNLDQINGTMIRTLIGHINDVKSIVFSPDGRVLASASLDQTIMLWNVSNGNPLLYSPLIHNPLTGVLSVTFSPDGGILASGCADSTIHL